MEKSLISRLLLLGPILLGLILLSPHTNAIGLGNATLKSWIGQPLHVTIAINDAENLTESDIIVRQIRGQYAQKLGFKDAIDHPRYAVATTTQKNQISIKVTTRQPVAEPYAHFILQIDMPGGSVNREYTLLIDMPPESKKNTNFSPLKTSPLAIEPIANRSDNLADSKQSPKQHSKPQAATADRQAYYVRNGDTLGEIAQRIRPDKRIRLQAIVSALHYNNIDAFEYGDINRLMPGSTLVHPSDSEYRAMPRRQRFQQPQDNSDKPQSSQPTQNIASNFANNNASNSESYQSYRIKSGDTLSQIAEILRPDAAIPLNKVIQLLISHNQDRVGPYGGRLSVGQTLRVPSDNTFYALANIQPQRTSNDSDSKNNTEISTPPQSIQAKVKQQVPIALSTKESSTPAPALIVNIKPRDYSDAKPDVVNEDIEALRASLKQINHQLYSLNNDINDPQLLSLFNQLINNQEQQLAIIQHLLDERVALIPPAASDSLPNIQNTTTNNSTALQDSLPKEPSGTSLAEPSPQPTDTQKTPAASLETDSVYLHSKANTAPVTKNNSSYFFYIIIALLILFILVLLIVFWTYSQRPEYQPYKAIKKAQSERQQPHISSTADKKLTANVAEIKHNESDYRRPEVTPTKTTIPTDISSHNHSQNDDFDSLFNDPDLLDSEDNVEHHNDDELFDLNIELDDTLDANTAEFDNSFVDDLSLNKPLSPADTLGASAEIEQNYKDLEVQKRLADRCLEASTQPTYKPSSVDSGNVELDEISHEDAPSIFSRAAHDDSDPDKDIIWQANIYAAYGQHERAESLLLEALSTTAESISLKLALLDIYARSEQHSEFEKVCAEIPKTDESIRHCIDELREQFNIVQL